MYLGVLEKKFSSIVFFLDVVFVCNQLFYKFVGSFNDENMFVDYDSL